MFWKRHILAAFWFVALVSLQVKAESVFIISSHSASKVQAYKINGDQVTYQDTVDISTYNPGYGAVGIAVWPSKELLFVTYENSPMIVWASTKTLEKAGEFDTGVNNLSGIMVDESGARIYVVQRNTANLYVYSYDEVSNTLHLEEQEYLTYPSEYGPQPVTAWGIDLDEGNGLLYVSNANQYVDVFQTPGWSHDHYIEIKVGDTLRHAVGIAVDPGQGYLYTGGYPAPSAPPGIIPHTYLVRTSTQPPYTSAEVQAGNYVVGIDASGGLVYCTVQPNEFRVYDSSLVLKDTETYGISGPAGVAVGGHYKPKVFSLSKTDGGVSCVSPDQLLNYTIQYSANGYADTSVIITDYLPVEADFVLCSGGGTYDPAKHTVTWNIGSISSQGSGSLQLQVRINQFANPGGSITNVVKMEGANYRGEATKETNVCCWGGEIIYVDKDAIGYKNGISWDNAYKDLQDALTGARNCPEKTAIWVAAGTYKPTTNPQDYLATFDLVDGIVIYGHFGGIGTYETSIGQRDFGNTGNETTLDGQIGSTPYESVRCVVSATGLGEVTIDGVTVKGSYSGTGAAGAYVSDSNIRIANCTFKNNDASGVYCTTDGQRSLDVSNCRFTGNTGHGIFCHRYTNIVTNTVFEGNSSGERGVTTEQSSIDLLDCTLRNHTGSALYANISDVLMERCSVTNNRYGISCEDSNPSIVDSLIKDNSGEGLWCINFSCVEIARSNVCTNGLDGIYLQDGQTTKITDNWIYNNGTSHDPIHGCGIYIKTQIGELLIRNNTIYGNNKHGIYFESGNQPQVVNCIIWANNPQIGTASGNPLAYVEYCCVQDGYVGTGNISSPPSFVDPSAGDYHIMYNSPCVNTGKPDSTDPGETDIDGEPRVISGIVDMGADEWECFPHCHPDYDEWVLVGRPECWCYPRQCHGDADGLKEGSAKKGYYYVHFDDLNVLLAGWNTKEPPFGPGIATVTGPNGEPGICADFAHDKEGSSKKGYWRVHFNDLNILIASWDVNEPDFGPGIPPDCLDCQRGQQAKGGELSIEEIMKWIEEIWLDPEARKVIDEDAWLKFIQSLMEELQRLVNGEW